MHAHWGLWMSDCLIFHSHQCNMNYQQNRLNHCLGWAEDQNSKDGGDKKVVDNCVLTAAGILNQQISHIKQVAHAHACTCWSKIVCNASSQLGHHSWGNHCVQIDPVDMAHSVTYFPKMGRNCTWPLTKSIMLLKSNSPVNCHKVDPLWLCIREWRATNTWYSSTNYVSVRLMFQEHSH